jgi:peptidyl-prolyl cis-trans isomerase C
MQVRSILAALLAAVPFIVHAAKAELPMDTPLVKDGSIVVDKADFEGSILRVPVQYRAEVRMNHEQVSTLIDSVFVNRVMADRARKDGLDKDVAVQRRIEQLKEAYLAQLYRDKIDAEPVPDFTQRARELYLAEQSKYVEPEQSYIQQILVTTKGRTPEMARARAEKAYEEAKAGKDEFLSYALRYSDEERRDGKIGDTGWATPDKLVAPVREAVAKMKKGEISPPVESVYGFHVIKLVDRKPAHQLSFDEAKGRIIAAETERFKKERLEKVIRDIRSSPTAHVYSENVDALVIPLDGDLLKRLQEVASGKSAAVTTIPAEAGKPAAGPAGQAPEKPSTGPAK